MGKIVKYCDSCEESFADKFNFCPNCASQLGAFEMNPLQAEAPVGAVETPQLSSEVNQFESSTPSTIGAENGVGHEPYAFSDDEEEILEIDDQVNNEFAEEAADEEFTEESESFEPAEKSQIFTSPKPAASDDYFNKPFPVFYKDGVADEPFSVTVIEEKNVKERNALLFASAIFMVVLSLAGVVYSLYEKNLDLAAIDQETLGIMPIIDDVPMDVEEPEKPKLKDDDGGGGGGGGREEQTPTSRGRLATQVENPIINPTKTIVQKDFELKQPIAATQGRVVAKQTEEPYGDPNSRFFDPSDGMGRGGGQGSGIGTGQGSGRGTGQGSGIGSGSGSGRGDGDGDGDGSGAGSRNRVAVPTKPPPPRPVGESKPLAITFKPKPRYTDEARQNNVTGTVRLRIQFLASGQIGSVSPVSGLGYGLTEQAIAAAKQMRFEPQMKDGQRVTVVKTVDFGFSIY
ncbi:MAG TPA: energy transducer TonB [Pyrinomonadaceae bacterium]|nr:energy transducer TonB [Pyrinomonadaceae bacterium]